MKLEPRMLLVLAVVVGVALVGCGRIAPAEPDSEVESLAASALEGVSFLPPLGTAVELSGDFDPDINLHLEVFNLTTGASIEKFSVGGDEISVTFEPGVEEQYHLNWHTRTANVPDGTIVRIEVRLSHARVSEPACNDGASLLRGCLAYQDVLLLRNRGRGGGRAANGLTTLVNGQTLPIKVHLRKGVVGNTLVGPGGGVAIGDDGVIVRIGADELEAVLSIHIARTAVPDVSLPSGVMRHGRSYILASRLMDGQPGQPDSLFASAEGLILALPVPELVDVERVAVAVLDPIGVPMNQFRPTWEFAEGQFDPSSRLLLVRLYGIPESGLIVQLVTGAAFTSDPHSLRQENTSVRSLGMRLTPLWLDRFIVQPLPGRNPLDAQTTSAYGTLLESMIPVFRDAGFPAFKLQVKGAKYECSQNLLTSLCGWNYDDAAYVARLAEFVDVPHFPQDVCQRGLGGTISGQYNGWAGEMSLCTAGLESGQVTHDEQDTSRHELMHSVQFRYRSIFYGVIGVGLGCEFAGSSCSPGERSGEYNWLLEGTAVLSERTLVGPDYHASVSRQPQRPLRMIDIPLLAGGPANRFAPYETQDFWAFIAKTQMNYTSADGTTGFGLFSRFLSRGFTPDSVNTVLLHDLGQPPTTLAQEYWAWAKNQAFERQIDLGDGTFDAMGACSPTPGVVKDETQLTASVPGPVFQALTIEPLTSRWIKVDISALAAARVEIAPEAGSTAIRAKLYRDSSVDGWSDCAAPTREAPSDFEYVSWSQLIEGQPDEPVYVLVANTDYSRARSVTVTVSAEHGVVSDEAAISITPPGLTNAGIGVQYTFEFTVSAIPASVAEVVFEWSFGDGGAAGSTGSSDVTAVLNGTATASAYYAYRAEGVYGLVVAVRDAGSDAVLSQQAVTIVIGEALEREYDLNICGNWRAAAQGGQGVTTDTWDISVIPPGAVFDIRYNTYTIPDRYYVGYPIGNLVLDTGWRGSQVRYDQNPHLYPGGLSGPGTGEELGIFTRIASIDNFLVSVIGPERGTAWRYEVRCRYTAP